MDLRKIISKGVSLRPQKPGTPSDGPITHSLKAMSKLNLEGKSISPIGTEIARIFDTRQTWILFVHTAGSGATPWRGLIILDANYQGAGQTETIFRVGLVAHELTHLLQRELNDSRHWPSGWLRFPSPTRLVGDSTNYMEVLSYIVGWTIEYDLYKEKLATNNLPLVEKNRIQGKLRSLKNGIATLTDPDARNATRFVLEKHRSMKVYKQNFRAEAKSPNGRIPAGGWEHWLGEFGFSEEAVAHIKDIGVRGEVKRVSQEEADRIVNA